MFNPALFRLLAATALAGLCALAQAQAGGKVSNLGGGAARGKLLTYNELAACLKEQTALTQRREKVEAQRKQLDGERQELQQLDETLKTERVKLDKIQDAVTAINQRTKDQEKAIVDFNERNAKLQQSTAIGPMADRERADLQRQREALEASGKQLDADRKALAANSTQDLQTFNARATAHTQAVDEWNTRNASLTKTAQAYEDDRAVWSDNCAGRPYREDDEKDILKGK